MKKIKKITLYVVTHKDVKKIIPERTLIGVGKKRPIENVFIYDDTGDNISSKNQNYCELTAMYWIWKNDRESDIVGIEHYRRQFISPADKRNLLTKDQIQNLLSRYDVIIPYSKNASSSIYHEYVKDNGEDDLIKTRSILINKYPEYVNDFDWMKTTNKIHPCNMFITSKILFDDYCLWLFNILFELEKQVDLSNRDAYHSRMPGFMAERLFNVYLHHNSLKTKELKIIEPDDIADPTQKYLISREIKYLIKKIINYKGMYRR